MILILSTLLSVSFAAKTVELTQDFHPAVKNEAADLWIPVPMELPGYQSVVSQKYFGNADKAEVETVGSVPMIHASWKKAENAEFHVVNVIHLQDHRGVTPESENVSAFLKPTKHVQTDGIVAETAKRIVGRLRDPDAKALAIYNWIVEKTERDPKVRGCGLGDLKTMLTVGNLRGKCADINSLFVGLARAAGVPAREFFGLRVDKSIESTALGKVDDVTTGQHCRAEYYSAKKKAWIPVDPADVRKVILEEKLALHDPKIERLRKKFFGYWEGNWAAFNDGRDLTLANPSGAIEVNYFMYPILTSVSNSPDGKDPKEVTYSLKSRIL